MVQTPVRQITLAEFLELPDTKPASEYIDGEIIQKPMPQTQHSVIQGRLFFEFTLAWRETDIAQAFPELRCIFGGRAVVPDVVVFEEANISYDDNGDIVNAVSIAPDWTIEILSPEQSMTRVLKNINHCLAHGTQMGWLIDPNDRSIFICMPDRNLQIIDEPTAVLPVPEFAAAIEMTVGQIFSWIKKKNEN
jgi:Uma2 family endonuclease